MSESRDDAAAYTAADVGFHVAVARATLNPLLPALLAPLATLIVKGCSKAIVLPTPCLWGSPPTRRCFEPLRGKTRRAPGAAMATHLRESRRAFPEQLVRVKKPARRRPTPA